MRPKAAPKTLIPLLVFAALCGRPALGQPSTPAGARVEPLPPELVGVGVDEHLNAQLPLDLEFVDHAGKKVRLRDYFDGQHPVILTLNYYKCPMLCALMLNGLLDAFRQLDWTAGAYLPTAGFVLIAVTKATRVVLYFMHLRYERPCNAIVLICALLFVMVFCALPLMDSRAYQPGIQAYRDADPAHYAPDLKRP